MWGWRTLSPPSLSEIPSTRSSFNAAQSAPDPDQLLREADRLAWLRAWTAAEPHFLQAQKLFVARGDHRHALYAEVSAFRGSLPRMSVPAASPRRSLAAWRYCRVSDAYVV